MLVYHQGIIFKKYKQNKFISAVTDFKKVKRPLILR